MGNKHQYIGSDPELLVTTTYATAVAVQDRRPYVLDGDKDADFVGIQRGGFGNPFDVITTSGRPLARHVRDRRLGLEKEKGYCDVGRHLARGN